MPAHFLETKVRSTPSASSDTGFIPGSLAYEATTPTWTDYLPSSPSRGTFSSRGITDSQRISEVSLKEKPLPLPSRWGKLSIKLANTKHQIRRSVRHSQWIPTNGWRSTVLAGAGLATATSIINIVVLAWGYTRPVDSQIGTTRILWEGDCKSTHNTFTVTHLAINICSTLLLGTSNATMQCLVAPTREAVDRAHTKGNWLDIGISGFRNWTCMDRWRMWCWVLLMISSLPLHLLYNSVIFQTTTANEYYALVVSSDFLSRGLAGPVTSDWDKPSQEFLSNLTTLAQTGALKRLDKKECIKSYKQPLLSEFSNVLVVTKNQTRNVTSLSFRHFPTPRFNFISNGSSEISFSDTGSGDQGSFDAGSGDTANWICDVDDDTGVACNLDDQLRDADTWNFTSYISVGPPPEKIPDKSSRPLVVDYCMAQQTLPQCTVQLIPEIMVTVLLCNVIKIICFIYAAYVHKFQPLITLGDALSSFIRQPDSTTRDLGPLSAIDIRNAEDSIRTDLIRRRTSPKFPLRLPPWRSKRYRWFWGASLLRWGLTYVLMIALWFMSWTFFAISSPLLEFVTLSDQWTSGFGNANGKLILTETSSFGVVGNILLANLPQLVLSLIYLLYNGLFTCILLSYEFVGYARRRQSLRVSNPSGYQRSSYFLTLPYRYGFPLLALAAILHWAISQSIFLAELKVLRPSGAFDPEHSASCLGYSTLGILVTSLLGTVAVIAPLVLGWRHYHEGCPLPESNSMAISAACHLDLGCETDLIRYGARGNQVGLSSGPVDPLIPGERYSSRENFDVQPHMRPSFFAIFSWRQKLLLGTAVLFKLAKFVLAILVFVDQYFDYSWVLPSVVVFPVTCLYFFAYWTTAIYKTWKKQPIRRFAWNVAPDIILFGVYIVMAATEALSPSNLSYITSASRYYGEWYLRPILIQIFNVAAWLISAVLETWLWLDQRQYRLGTISSIYARHVRPPETTEA